MQIYLVGGAVRDKLLGRPILERDWVVVGARPEQLLAQGFQQVGKDFPVFLHPHTHEEYALARTERKSGHGYTGFSFDTAPSVTLEEDLLRRDLTINAMAEDADGRLIDPYQGRADLQAKKLRHVSAAFAEDPLRVLRVARFAARYAHLGFSVADETLTLMRSISASGELQHLTPERIWKETEKALGEANPEVYFQVLRDSHALAIILPELNALFGVPQTPAHHPEIDTGLHSLMALQQACLLTPDAGVRFAALIHDLGKGVTAPALWPRHIGHEYEGTHLIKQACARLRVPKQIEKLCLLTSEFHTHCHRALALRTGTLLKLFEALGCFRQGGHFEGFLLACEADARGRTGLEQRPYPQPQFLREACAAAQAISAKDWLAKGYQGEKLGQAMRCARSKAIKSVQKTWREKTANGS
ncbi:MAG TPA: multifunctional CCA addition/repair protein [Pseudomonadales bacterium]|nr:multifunctional CCA addition/repair protein [Pseudomonadales bacterium]